ncbi:LamG domain-containing protein [Candidatus Woesearchaeota archaeon]|jgi:hypothetical protein|nr:LamG domain-containing protein [Candidatus Woesearchaeota archaeon]
MVKLSFKMLFALIFSCALLSVGVFAAPSISYVTPTPQNNAYTGNESFVEMNVRVNESQLNEFNYNWNGTNFTYYDDSLVLMMNFDDVSDLGETNTLFADVSMYGNDGSANPGITYTTSGKYDDACLFDGSSDYITVSNSSSLNDLTTLSISAWIYADSFDAVNPYIDAIVSKFTGGSTGFVFRVGDAGINSNQLQMAFDSNKIQSDIGLQTDTWYHVATTYDGTTAKLFINGVEDASAEIIGWQDTSDNNLEIGRDFSTNSRIWDGTIDEVRIWNRSLSSNEIYQQYVSNLNQFNSTQWRFYVNQSQNATTGLDNSSYTYFVSAKNASDSETVMSSRTINIGSAPAAVPEFSDYAIMLLLALTVGGFVVIRKKD